MALQTTLQSLQNRLSSGFAQVANKFLGNPTLESKSYRFEGAIDYAQTFGIEQLRATPTLKDANLYAVSRIGYVHVITKDGKKSRSFNDKVLNPANATYLFSKEDVLDYFSKFEAHKEQESKPKFGELHYKPCK